MNLLRTSGGILLCVAVLALIAGGRRGIAASSWAPTLIVNTEAFQVIDDADSEADVVIKFGDTLAKTLTYERTAGRFRFNDDLSVVGSISGSSLTIDDLSTSGAVLFSRGTNPSVAQTARGSSGQVLLSQGAHAPVWKDTTTSMVWYLGGTQSVGTQKGAIVTMPFGFLPTDVVLRIHGAPTGAALIVDINENGSSIFSTRPQINDGATEDASGHTFSDTDLAAGSEVTVHVDQVGSTFAGSGLTILLQGTRKY